MSRLSKGSIFFHALLKDDTEVSFFEVVRSTTNTCEVVSVSKNVVAQDDFYQFVEPDLSSRGFKKRCKVISSKKIMLKEGEYAVLWDGLPVRQTMRIFLLGDF